MVDGGSDCVVPLLFACARWLSVVSRVVEMLWVVVDVLLSGFLCCRGWCSMSWEIVVPAMVGRVSLVLCEVTGPAFSG